MTVALPAGITPEMMAAMAKFFASLPSADIPRPTGRLQANQIRGVNPNYQHVYKPYPKALNPPSVIVRSVEEERRFRTVFGMPLPWNAAQPDQREYMSDYFSSQDYPKKMVPPQIIVQSADEEIAVKAGWRSHDEEADQTVLYPRWLFHDTEAPVMVQSVEQEESLGEGWYPSMGALREAMANRSDPGEQTIEEALSKDKLLDKAIKMGIKGVDKRWSEDRLRNAIAKAEKLAA